MKILYIALKYDYGRPEKGYSFEYFNFYDSLVKMNKGEHEIIFFPFDEIMKEVGKEQMNEKLISTVENIKPELCFFFLFGNEIEKETIKKITAMSGTKTFNWFADDHWRFDTFSKYYAPCFNFFSTTDSMAVEKYKKIGLNKVIKTQWACNHFLYKPQADLGSVSYKHDVSFVGQMHSDRKNIAEGLAKNGAKIDCYGYGWPNGKVSQDQMIKTFYNSKINLNLTKGSGFFSLKSFAKVFIKKEEAKYSLNSPLKWPDNFKTFLGHQRDQIKGRTFEIPGCGGFLLTSYADDLNNYYKDGEEIIIFKNKDDLVNKINYYLNNDPERKKIAEAGYLKTINLHTYEKRFNEIFSKLPCARERRVN